MFYPRFLVSISLLLVISFSGFSATAGDKGNAKNKNQTKANQNDSGEADVNIKDKDKEKPKEEVVAAKEPSDENTGSSADDTDPCKGVQGADTGDKNPITYKVRGVDRTGTSPTRIYQQGNSWYQVVKWHDMTDPLKRQAVDTGYLLMMKQMRQLHDKYKNPILRSVSLQIDTELCRARGELHKLVNKLVVIDKISEDQFETSLTDEQNSANQKIRQSTGFSYQFKLSHFTPSGFIITLGITLNNSLLKKLTAAADAAEELESLTTKLSGPLGPLKAAFSGDTFNITIGAVAIPYIVRKIDIYPCGNVDDLSSQLSDPNSKKALDAIARIEACVKKGGEVVSQTREMFYDMDYFLYPDVSFATFKNQTIVYPAGVRFAAGVVWNLDKAEDFGNLISWGFSAKLSYSVNNWSTVSCKIGVQAGLGGCIPYFLLGPMEFGRSADTGLSFAHGKVLSLRKLIKLAEATE